MEPIYEKRVITALNGDPAPWHKQTRDRIMTMPCQNNIKSIYEKILLVAMNYDAVIAVTCASRGEPIVRPTSPKRVVSVFYYQE